MLLVGLTGNIASGKSTVARMFAARGATIVDADTLARQAVQPGTPALVKIRERWGDAVLTGDGSLDRSALRHVVFADPAELEALNSIVHPEVSRMRDLLVQEARTRGDAIVVCDIPLLFERGLVNDFDRIILVDAPRELRLERLGTSRGIDAAEGMRMIAAQMPAELKRSRADYIIENDSTVAELEQKVAIVWDQLSRGIPSHSGRPGTSDTPPRIN